jgi:hypothetical protein
MDSCGSGGNETSSTIKGGKFFDQLCQYQLLKEDSSLLSYIHSLCDILTRPAS